MSGFRMSALRFIALHSEKEATVAALACITVLALPY